MGPDRIGARVAPISQELPLRARLDALYQGYNREDAAADPIQIVRRYSDPADCEVIGFCAAALAFGRVASVLNSIETLVSILGARPSTFVRTFDPAAPHVALRGMVHRWTRGRDLVALLWLIRQMLDRSGSIERFFVEGFDAERSGRRRCARQLLVPRDGAGSPGGVRPAPSRARRRALFLSAPVGRQRVQAPEPVPPLDGPARRGGSRRLDVRLASKADRPARYPRDPARPLPETDALHVSGLAHGFGDHGVASSHRSGRPRPVRFFALSRRHDERLRLRPPAGRRAMSAQGNVPAARPGQRAGRAIVLAIAAFVFTAAGFASGWLIGGRRTVLTATSPARDAVAFVYEGRCAAGFCQALVCRAEPARRAIDRDAERRRRARRRDRVDA